MTLLTNAIKGKVQKEAKEIIERALLSKEANISDRNIVVMTVAYMEPISELLSKIGGLTNYAKAVSVSIVGGLVLASISYVLHLLGLI